MIINPIYFILYDHFSKKTLILIIIIGSEGQTDALPWIAEGYQKGINPSKWDASLIAINKVNILTTLFC